MILSLFGPVNIFTVNFMPESMYFFSFWVVTWFLLGVNDSSSLRSYIIGGCLLGLSALVKPHALFLLPAVIAYILYSGVRKDEKWVVYVSQRIVLFIAFALITKMFVGSLIAGKQGLVIFGSTYGGILDSSGSQLQHYIDLLRKSLHNISGHVMALCLMFGLPLGIAIIHFVTSLKKLETRDELQKISFYSLVVLGSLVIIVGLFTLSVANSGPYETDLRLHMRYYSFCFPLLLIIAGSQVCTEHSSHVNKWHFFAIFPILFIMAYAFDTGLSVFQLGYVDCLETLIAMGDGFYILSFFSLFSLVCWMFSKSISSKVFLCVYMPFFMMFSGMFIDTYFKNFLHPDLYVKAGRLVQNYLPEEEHSKLLIVGSHPGGLFKSLYYADNPRSSLEVIEVNAVYDIAKVSLDKKWLLVIGDNAVSDNSYPAISNDGYRLFSLDKNYMFLFNGKLWPRITFSTGLSPVESWGRWSEGKQVVFNFLKPLPKEFTLQLKALAFGPNIGQDFVATVGTSVVKFKLEAAPQDIQLHFTNPTNSNTLTIDIPQPTSPASLNGGVGDQRLLGIGLIEMEILTK